MGMLARAFEYLCDFLFPRADTARIVAETSVLEFGALLTPSVAETGIIALLPYRHTRVRAAILEAKFHRSAQAFALLGAVLADYLAGMLEETAAFEKQEICIVPVPLGPARRRERGYNQVEEVAKRTGTAIAPSLLRRMRDTLPQTSLTRAQRLMNMEDAFEVRGPLDPSYTYIVLDDVLTTGATLRAATDALRQAGATNLMGLALAH
jgi:predicted amidophosphoribosyltransferase